MSLFQRIESGKDIAQIALCYASGKIEQFIVPWENGKCEYENKLQNTFYTDGKPVIAVSDTGTV